MTRLNLTLAYEKEAYQALHESLANFADSLAEHFEREAADAKEDSEHWANVFNAEQCHKIAALLRSRERGELP
jgi:DNA-binding MurR/RpiR family transcriptional regulator